MLKKDLIGINILKDPNNYLNIGQIREFIKKSSVNFSKSDTSKDSCKIYSLDGYLLNEYKEILFENCSKTIKIIKIK